MRINGTQVCQYIDVPGDDPSLDWFVIADDITGNEASLPVTRLPELIDATRGTIDDGDDLTVRGEPFQGMPAQTVTIPSSDLNTLISCLLYFQDGASQPTRPPVEVQSFDNTDELLAALGLVDRNRGK